MKDFVRQEVFQHNPVTFMIDDIEDKMDAQRVTIVFLCCCLSEYRHELAAMGK
jgi:hypothetical protein